MIISKGYYVKLDDNCNADDYISSKEMHITCYDSNGYKYDVNKNNFSTIKNNGKIKPFNACNPYAVDNINILLNKQKIPFTCTSHYKDKEFIYTCNRCGNAMTKSWRIIHRKAIINGETKNIRLHCDNCDGNLESVHALVLKQLFLHYHPDTIVEDKSCRNPLTNCIMPTDIVNHRLKIAIEIQSEWHDVEYSKTKDKIKKRILGQSRLFFLCPRY